MVEIAACDRQGARESAASRRAAAESIRVVVVVVVVVKLVVVVVVVLVVVLVLLDGCPCRWRRRWSVVVGPYLSKQKLRMPQRQGRVQTVFHSPPQHTPRSASHSKLSKIPNNSGQCIYITSPSFPSFPSFHSLSPSSLENVPNVSSLFRLISSKSHPLYSLVPVPSSFRSSSR